jgi:hypothetical protein
VDVGGEAEEREEPSSLAIRDFKALNKYLGDVDFIFLLNSFNNFGTGNCESKSLNLC